MADIIAQKEFLDEVMQAFDKFKRRSPSSVPMAPPIAELYHHMSQKERELRAEKRRLQFLPTTGTVLNTVRRLRNGEKISLDREFDEIKETFDLEINFKHLIVMALRPDMKEAMLRAIEENSHKIRSILYYADNTFLNGVSEKNLNILPATAAFEALTMEIYLQLFWLKSLHTVGIRLKLSPQRPCDRFIDRLAAIAWCRSFKKLVVIDCDFAWVAMDLFVGPSMFFEMRRILELEAYTLGIDQLRPLLRSIAHMRDLESLKLMPIDGSSIEIEEAEDAQLVRAVLQMPSLRRLTIKKLECLHESLIGTIYQGFATSNVKELALETCTFEANSGIQAAEALIGPTPLTKLAINSIAFDTFTDDDDDDDDDVEHFYSLGFFRTMALRLGDSATGSNLQSLALRNNEANLYAIALDDHEGQWKIKDLELVTLGWNRRLLNSLAAFTLESTYLTSIRLGGSEMLDHREAFRGLICLLKAVKQGPGSLDTFEIIDSDIFDDFMVEQIQRAVTYHPKRLQRAYGPVLAAIKRSRPGNDRRETLVNALVSMDTITRFALLRNPNDEGFRMAMMQENRVQATIRSSRDSMSQPKPFLPDTRAKKRAKQTNDGHISPDASA